MESWGLFVGVALGTTLPLLFACVPPILWRNANSSRAGCSPAEPNSISELKWTMLNFCLPISHKTVTEAQGWGTDSQELTRSKPSLNLAMALQKWRENSNIEKSILLSTKYLAKLICKIFQTQGWRYCPNLIQIFKNIHTDHHWNQDPITQAFDLVTWACAEKLTIALL